MTMTTAVVAEYSLTNDITTQTIHGPA
jgi:hypothetical protein